MPRWTRLPRSPSSSTARCACGPAVKPPRARARFHPACGACHGRVLPPPVGSPQAVGRQVLGQPLVSWSQGQPARLTPFADRLLWAETRARARLTPHIEALRAELSRVLTDALDGTQQVLTVFASHDLALPLLREHAAAPWACTSSCVLPAAWTPCGHWMPAAAWWPAFTCRCCQPWVGRPRSRSCSRRSSSPCSSPAGTS
jgi:hypothetical protein